MLTIEVAAIVTIVAFLLGMLVCWLALRSYIRALEDTNAWLAPRLQDMTRAFHVLFGFANNPLHYIESPSGCALSYYRDIVTPFLRRASDDAYAEDLREEGE